MIRTSDKDKGIILDPDSIRDISFIAIFANSDRVQEGGDKFDEFYAAVLRFKNDLVSAFEEPTGDERKDLLNFMIIAELAGMELEANPMPDDEREANAENIAQLERVRAKTREFAQRVTDAQQGITQPQA